MVVYTRDIQVVPTHQPRSTSEKPSISIPDLFSIRCVPPLRPFGRSSVAPTGHRSLRSVPTEGLPGRPVPRRVHGGRLHPQRPPPPPSVGAQRRRQTTETRSTDLLGEEQAFLGGSGEILKGILISGYPCEYCVSSPDKCPVRIISSCLCCLTWKRRN